MALRTRIAVTFLALLAVVLTAALGAVSAANRLNAERDVKRQLDLGASVFSRLLETNRRQLTQAAQAVAADFGFREAVAANDTDTLVSALENSGERVGAELVVLTSLDGKVQASSGSQVAVGTPFAGRVLEGDQDFAPRVMVDGGKIYELVAVAVRSPLPVAWIVMGFVLDDKATRELADITGLGVTLSLIDDGVISDAVSSLPAGLSRQDEVVSRRIDIPSVGKIRVTATLTRSLTEARAPFARLTKTLVIIAILSLIAFAWAAFMIARNITSPMRDLTRSIAQIRNGAYDITLNVHRRDELGMLAEGLELMQTAVKSRDQAIRRLAYEDTLTGLMNRTSFGAALAQCLNEAGGAVVGVAVINLQRFRRINEHLGYSVGDAVLINIARRLSEVPSVHSAIARLAADQFAAFTRLPTDGNLTAWGTSLLVALSDPVVVEAQPIDVSATIGLGQASGTHSSADELLRCAELALEQGRREKRALAVYQAALKPAARDQLSLLGELRQALERGELQLYFQPKIEIATGRVAGAEVLLRWQHPARGLLNPAAFIPFAEQTGFIRRMTRWTLDRAIAQGAEWYRAGLSLPLAVNISADDIGDARLDARVAALLTRHQLPPALLTLEITESGFIEDPERALRMLDALAALGVSLSIDDFGTGYSSLSHLARMPVHEVKIDRSFVLGMESDEEFASVVKSAIDMGHGLGLKVVVEGIEAPDTAQRFKEFGCDIAQGYLYAVPMPAAALHRWLESRERVPVIAMPVDFKVENFADTISLAAY